MAGSICSFNCGHSIGLAAGFLEAKAADAGRFFLRKATSFSPGMAMPTLSRSAKERLFGADHADDGPAVVEQRPAAIARVDAAIQLDLRFLVAGGGHFADDARRDGQRRVGEVFPRVARGRESHDADRLSRPSLRAPPAIGVDFDSLGNLGLQQRDVAVDVLGDQLGGDELARPARRTFSFLLSWMT